MSKSKRDINGINSEARATNGVLYDEIREGKKRQQSGGRGGGGEQWEYLIQFLVSFRTFRNIDSFSM